MSPRAVGVYVIVCFGVPACLIIIIYIVPTTKVQHDNPERIILRENLIFIHFIGAMQRKC